jgi:hypothetical protein
MTMSGKRQHYLPQFHQRRFGIEPRNKKTQVWRLDKKSGKPERVDPSGEAVIDHYYSVTLEDGTVVDHADNVLGRFESDAAPVIERIVKDPGYRVTGPDVQALLLYIVTLKNRTPRAREGLRESDERANELLFEAMLSDQVRYHRTMAKHDGSSEELESTRLKLLADLRAGEIVVESEPDREVAMMLIAVEGTARKLCEDIGVHCLRVPAESKAVFVTSDHPVAHYDPTPKTPESGVSFMSSPGAVTLVAVDPRLALLLVQDHPQRWADEGIGEDDVNEANLLTYAWAQSAIYGPSQFAVTRVRALAKRNHKLLGEFRYRPPRVWIGRGGDPSKGGPVEFSSRFKDQMATRTFHVAPDSMADESRRVWPRDEDPSDGSCKAAAAEAPAVSGDHR